MPYTEQFKRQMVAKMTGRGAVSASALAPQVGVSQPTLSEWLRRAKVGAMAKNKKIKVPKRPQDWTAVEKLEVVREARGVSDEQLGVFLRSRGVKQSDLEQWRRQMLAGLEAGGRRPSKSSPEARRIRELEKELNRKEKALAEAAALLVLKKKAEAIWGGEAENTTRRNGE
jgi:transposase-like protein